MLIRDERPDDFESIASLNRLAFGGDAEAALVSALRAEHVVIASRVAVEDDTLVGHILFSEVRIVSATGETTIASLAPMAVHPDFQRRGIGTALIRNGIEICRAKQYPAIIVVGHTDYYPRFGFSPAVVAHLGSPYTGPAFMGFELVPGTLASAVGCVRYPAAFDSL